MLNERFDSTLQRIYITVVNQYPFMAFAGDGEPSPTSFITSGELTGYYFLPDGAIPQMYNYEFLVHVPADITFVPKVMFDLLDLYRYAGRRPAIRRFDPDDSDVEIILYVGLELIANDAVFIDPTFETG